MISFIGVVPNFIAAFFILGIIGLMGIPLDMMTITIAAITIGIAVDNSIHYIYRFREEFKKFKNYIFDIVIHYYPYNDSKNKNPCLILIISEHFLNY